MSKGDKLPDMPKGLHRRPTRRMSIFTASQTLKAAVGWSHHVRGDRRDSHRSSMMRRDSVKTDGSSLQPPAKPVVRLENTYKTAPDEGAAFKAYKAKPAIEEILKETLQGKTYDPNEAARLCLQIASMVKTFCKEMSCPRFKFVSHVVIGQNLNQSIESASRGMWDTNLDGFVYGTFRNDSIFAIVTVFALYYE